MIKNNYLKKILVTTLTGIMLFAAVGCGKEISTDAAEKSSEAETASSAEGTDNTVSAGTSSDQANAEASESKGDVAGISESDKKAAEESFTQKVLDIAGDVPTDVKETLVDDFDGDGKLEGFVFLGKTPTEVLGSCGDLWFISDEVCEQVFEQKNIEVNESGSVFKSLPVEKVKFVNMTECYVSESYSRIFYVKDGMCEESRISGLGYLFKSTVVGDYAVTQPAYDRCIEYEIAEGEEDGISTGHTWKDYYAYFDKDERDFFYYDHKRISEDELTSICGMNLAEEIRNEGFKVDSIYRVDNGIVIVNYEKETTEGNTVFIEYHNASYYEKTKEFLDYGVEGDKPWQKSDQGGTYFGDN